MLKSDLHLHTNQDSLEKQIKYSPKQLINYMSKLNFKVISITHHQKIYYNQDLKNYAKRKNILLIPGTELEIKGKHVLIYNIKKEYLTKIKNFNDLEKIKNQNTIIAAPHPFFIKPTCLKSKLLKYIDFFDAIEFSHFYTSYLNLNKKAVKIAKKYNKTIIGNSDAHHLKQINLTYSLIDSKKNIDSLLEAIRKNKIKLITKPLPFLTFLKITLHNLFKI